MNKHFSTAGIKSSLSTRAEQTEKLLKGWLSRLTADSQWSAQIPPPYASFIHPIAPPTINSLLVILGQAPPFFPHSVHSQMHLLEMDNSLLFPDQNPNQCVEGKIAH